MNLKHRILPEFNKRLPLARGDESAEQRQAFEIFNVCPSQEGMNRPNAVTSLMIERLPLARGDESYTGESGLLLYVSAPCKRG